MDMYMPMSTTVRHNKLIYSFLIKLGTLIEKKEVHILQENCPLVYWGNKEIVKGFNLVNVSDIEDAEHFRNVVINDLDYVQPDFMMFKDNPYVENERGTRTAGQPDLIVEVWSDRNTKNDRDFLQNLYATSPTTEHWYIEQDSNEVKCYYGNSRIENQYLFHVLRTRNGLEFDLRYLAIK